MTSSHLKSILLGALLVLGTVFFMFSIEKTKSLQEIRWQVLEKSCNTLLDNKLFQPSLDEVNKSIFNESYQPLIKQLKNRIDKKAQEHQKELWANWRHKWEAKWFSLNQKQQIRAVLELEYAQKAQLSQHRNFFIKKIQELQDTTKKTKSQIIKNSTAAKQTAKPKKPQPIKLKKRTVTKENWLQSLDQDYKELLAYEKNQDPIIKVEKILRDSNSREYRLNYQKAMRIIKEVNSPAFIPLILETMWKRKNDVYNFHISQALTSLTGKKVSYMHARNPQIAQELTLDWWVPNKEKIVRDLLAQKAVMGQLVKTLEQDFQQLVARHPPLIKARLQEAKNLIESTNHRNQLQAAAIFYELRSKASIPLLLKALYLKRNSHSSTNNFAKVITVLTGKKIEELYTSRARERQRVLESLISNWWMAEKKSINTEFSKMNENQKIVVIKALIQEMGYRQRISRNNTASETRRLLQQFTRKLSYRDERKTTQKGLRPSMVPVLLSQVSLDNYWQISLLLAHLREQGKASDLHQKLSTKDISDVKRFTILLALWRAGEDMSTHQLLNILERNQHILLRLSVVLALGYTQDKQQVLPVLANLLSKQHQEIRMAACYSLLKLKPQNLAFRKDLVPQLKAMMATSKQEVILELLTSIKTQEAQTVLAQNLEKTLHSSSKKSHSLRNSLKFFERATGQNWYEGSNGDYEDYYQAARSALSWWNNKTGKAKQQEKKSSLQVAQMSKWLNIKQRKKIYVKKNAAISANGSKDQPFGNIKSATSIAKTGDIIYIQKGVYRENIYLPQGVWLKGESPVHCVIEGTLQISSASVVEGMTIRFSNPGLQIANVDGAMVRGCWIYGVYDDRKQKDAKGVLIKQSHNVIFLQNVVYDISEQSHGSAFGIHMQQSSGMIVNNIIGRINETDWDSAYGISLEKCPKGVAIYNNTIAFLKETNWDSAYGICVDPGSQAAIKNNIIYNLYTRDKSNYGIVNRSDNCTIAYNGVFEVSKAYSGPVVTGNQQLAPRFLNAANGDFRLDQISPYLHEANNKANPHLEALDQGSFFNQVGACGGYFPFTDKMIEQMQVLKPKSHQLLSWEQYQSWRYTKIKRYIEEFASTDENTKTRARRTILRYRNQGAIPLLKLLAEKKAPIHLHKLQQPAQQLLQELRVKDTSSSKETWAFPR